MRDSLLARGPCKISRDKNDSCIFPCFSCYIWKERGLHFSKCSNTIVASLPQDVGRASQLSFKALMPPTLQLVVSSFSEATPIMAWQ